MKVFLYQMKDASSIEMQISQYKSMELDAFRKEENHESLYIVHRPELEKSKCSSDEGEDDKSINNKTFPTRSILDQKFI